MSRLFNLFAATASIGLFSGLVYWGVALSQMDPNEIPVIKRAAGPARIAPDDPGGEQASHQGLSVNTIQAEGGAGDTAMKVILAPKPRPFQPEDLAGLEKAKPAVAQKSAENSPVLKPIVASLKVPVLPEQVTEQVSEKAVSDGLKKSAEELEKTAVATVTKTEAPEETVLVAKPILKRPLIRPSSLTVASVAGASKSEVTSSLPAGTPLVQIGAFESNDIANSELVKFTTKHEDLLAEKSFIIQKALSGGKTFYRLRVKGFETSNDAKSFCSALKARSTDCITSIVR